MARAHWASLTRRRIPAGVAYVVWSGVGIVLMASIGWFRYGQILAAPAILGLALIILGILGLKVVSKISPQAWIAAGR